jgi:phosphopantothenoylcysteine decarboxylase/phosphopantothenate--cysteine ligase
VIVVSVGPTAGALTAPPVVTELAAAGHEVQVILEPGTEHFVGPGYFLSASTVVENPSGVPDVVLFLPTTAGTLARLSHGLDHPASEARAAGVPVFLAPDLDAATVENPAVRSNLEALRRDGVKILQGEGDGMAGVEEVVAGVLGGLGGPLVGRRVLVTAGGTHEPLDSVRFIGNRSSGKMGLALAREALKRGAEVTVVAANIGQREPGVAWRDVSTVRELRDEVLREAGEADVLVMAAAVSDFTPAAPAEEKIRRSSGVRSIELAPTPDVLQAVREQNPGLFMVGFAATHGDPASDAREKLEKKGADIVVGNDISREGVGFGAEENEVYVVSGRGERFVPRATKAVVAGEVLDDVQALLEEER